MLISVGMALSLAVLAIGAVLSAQDKYTLHVPNGLAFAEFKGYEDWPVIAISHNGGLIAVILGNAVMIDAYKAGVPGNGQPLRGAPMPHPSPSLAVPHRLVHPRLASVEAP
jgi:hypothetical protein